jgi:hypothetical protein
MDAVSFFRVIGLRVVIIEAMRSEIHIFRFIDKILTCEMRII